MPVLDSATPGSGIWRLALTRQWRADRFDVLGYLKLDNLGNQLATNATATATIRGLAPQPGAPWQLALSCVSKACGARPTPGARTGYNCRQHRGDI